MAKDLASAAGSARGNAADGWQQGAMLDGATAGRGEEGSAVRGGAPDVGWRRLVGSSEEE